MYSRKDAEAQRINSLAAYFLWGGAKNKLLGGFAALRETKFFFLKNEVQYVIIEIKKWLKKYTFKSDQKV